MQVQLIRGATLRFEYKGKRFIIDPYLSAKRMMPSYTGTSELTNPLVELLCSPLEVIAGIEMAIISHLHSDHFDPAAQRLLPKDMPILCQPEDESKIKAKGFQKVIPLIDTIKWNGITISRTVGQHGMGKVLKVMGNVSGFVFQAEGANQLYIGGEIQSGVKLLPMLLTKLNHKSLLLIHVGRYGVTAHRLLWTRPKQLPYAVLLPTAL